MKYLGRIENGQDAATKEYVDKNIPGGGSDYATRQEVIDDEEVAAVALIDHEDRIAKLEVDVPTNYATKVLLSASREELLQIILDNEEVIASALTDLDKRLKEHEVS